MYILEGIEKPNASKYDWKINPNESFVSISSVELGVDTLKNKVFTIALTISDFYSIEFSYFKFKVVLQYYATPNLIPLSNEEEEICETFHDNEYCYFIFEMNKYELIDFVGIYTYIEDDIQAISEIFVSEEPKETLGTSDYLENITNILPYKGNSGYSSKTNYFKFSNDQMDGYLIIGVLPPYPTKLHVLSNVNRVTGEGYFNTFNNKMYSYHSSSSTMYISHISSFELKNRKYTFQCLSLLEGSTFYTKFPLVNDRQIEGQYYLNVENETLTLLKHGLMRNFFIGSIYPVISTLNSIKTGKNTIESVGKSFPFSFYFKINKNKMNSTIMYTFNTLDYNIKKSNDTFNMIAYVVNDAFIKEYAINPDIEFKGEELNIQYLSSNKTYYLNYYIEKLESKIEDEYIFVNIKQSAINRNIYSHMVLEVQAFYSYNFKEIPKYKYVSDVIENYDTYRIPMNTYISIEYAIPPKKVSDPDYKIEFSYEFYKEIASYKNESQSNIVVVNDTQIQGKNVVLLKVLNTKSNWLIVTFKVASGSQLNENNQVKILLRYENSNNKITFETIKNDAISSFRRGKTVELMFKTFYQYSSNGLYYIQFFSKNDFAKIEDVKSIYYDIPCLYQKKLQLKNAGDERIETIILPDENEDVYLKIVVMATYTSEEFLLSYNPILIEKSIEKFELLEQKIFYNKTVTNSPLTLRLKKKVLTEEYFIIRFAFEPKSSSSSALDFSIEKYTDSPKYQNDTEIIDKNLTVNGMRRVKVKYYNKTDYEILINFFPTDSKSSSEINLMIYYYSATKYYAIEDYSQFDISAYLTKGNLKVSFKELAYSTTTKGSSYIVKLYNKKDFTSINGVL